MHQGHVTQQIDSCYTGAKPESQLRSPGLRQKFSIPTDQRLDVRAAKELWLKHSVEACAYPIIIILATNGTPDPVTGAGFVCAAFACLLVLCSQRDIFADSAVILLQACAARTRRPRTTLSPALITRAPLPSQPAFRSSHFSCSYVTLSGALEAGLTASVAKQKLEYMVSAH